jgi:natural product precursor
MKQLSKLKLKEFVEMDDYEMKHLLGGENTGTATPTSTASSFSCSDGQTACESGTHHCCCEQNYKGCYSIADCVSECLKA